MFTIPITINLDFEDPLLKETADRINKDFPKTAKVLECKTMPGFAVYVTKEYYSRCTEKSIMLSTRRSNQSKAKTATINKVNVIYNRLERARKKRGLQ